MRGPLPQEQKRRRNAPTVPTTELPAEGRQGPAPKCPYQLGRKGATWWRWAWKTPHAAAWSETGHLYVVGRRASLEDDLHVLDFVDGAADLLDVLGMPRDEASDQVDWLIRKLKALAGGRLNVLREMRELDDRLGLTPKAAAQMRLKVIGAESPTAKPAESETTGTRRQRLQVV